MTESAPAVAAATRAGWWSWFRGLPVRAVRAVPDLALAAACGCLVFLSFPMWDWYGLMFIALVPLWFRAEKVTVTRAFWMGTMTGWVTNLGGFYWIMGLLKDFTGMPWWLNGILYGLLCAQQGLLFGVATAAGRWLAPVDWLPAGLRFPLTLALTDAVWPMIFKWYLGNSQYLNTPLAQLAELGGVPLVTVAVCVTSGAVWTVAERLRAGSPMPMHRRWEHFALATVLLSFGWGAYRSAAVDAVASAAATHRIGLVEANIGIYEKTDPQLYRNNLLIHQRLSAEVVAAGAELVVWPETAYLERDFVATTDPVVSEEEARASASVRGLLPRDVTWLPPASAPLVESRDADLRAGTPVIETLPPQRGFRAPLLTGAVMVQRYDVAQQAVAPPRGSGLPRTYGVFNSAVLLSSDGQVLGVYDKNVLMPFSESVPLGRELWKWFGINLYAIIPASGEMERGTPMDRAFELPDAGGTAWRAGVLICYEDINPRMSRELVRRIDPHVIINMTNDAWFGKTAEPWLHLALATFRAIETRRFVLRSTNTGVSAVIDSSGRVVAHTSLEDEETLLYDVPMLASGRTLFSIFGDWSTWIVLLVLLFAVRSGIRARRKFDVSPAASKVTAGV